MTRLVRWILVASCLMIAWVCLYVPWKWEYRGQKASLDYAPLWSPPSSERFPYGGAILDFERLMVELLAIGALSGGTVLLCGLFRRNGERVPSKAKAAGRQGPGEPLGAAQSVASGLQVDDPAPRPEQDAGPGGSFLKEQIREHWKTFRPRMYRGLVKAGKLEQSLDQAVDQTKDAVADSLLAGANPDQAWEGARELWAFLPSETEVPNLPAESQPAGLRGPENPPPSQVIPPGKPGRLRVFDEAAAAIAAKGGEDVAAGKGATGLKGIDPERMNAMRSDVKQLLGNPRLPKTQATLERLISARLEEGNLSKEEATRIRAEYKAQFP
jgi:hypothetical protein